MKKCQNLCRRMEEKANKLLQFMMIIPVRLGIFAEYA